MVYGRAARRIEMQNKGVIRSNRLLWALGVSQASSMVRGVHPCIKQSETEDEDWHGDTGIERKLHHPPPKPWGHPYIGEAQANRCDPRPHEQEATDDPRRAADVFR